MRSARTHVPWVRSATVLLAAVVGVIGCGQVAERAGSGAYRSPIPATDRRAIPVRVERTSVSGAARACEGRFVGLTLPHTTSAGPGPVELYESNGAGLGIGDLDGDGDLDVVLANLAGPDTMLWNEGGLRFRGQSLGEGGSRSVALVDVDGDGRQDVVLTRHTLEPVLWRNRGGGRFTEEALPGVEHKAYAQDWGDVDGDGDLDMASGSYDLGLEKDLGLLATRNHSGMGAYLHQQHEGEFLPTRLSEEANALAIALPPAGDRDLPDILIGNDFGTPDGAWERDGAGWRRVSPFGVTTHSTMSLDLGDIDNDGGLELYATDMKPYAYDVAAHAKWRPMMLKIPHERYDGVPQVMENVLQRRGASGRYENEAYAREVDATGWSWSGKFGDLDQDGLLDLYVVNGMIAQELFGYLPRGELVEENQAFRNVGSGGFERTPGWGLGSKRSGRGMSMADLDRDGDLDVVVNNLGSPAQLFENRLCVGASLQVDLSWARSRNTRAVGATLVLHTSAGTMRRDVRVQSGYLSGDPARVHFGFPKGARLERLEVLWPDGGASEVRALSADSIVRVRR